MHICTAHVCVCAVCTLTAAYCRGGGHQEEEEEEEEEEDTEVQQLRTGQYQLMHQLINYSYSLVAGIKTY